MKNIHLFSVLLSLGVAMSGAACASSSPASSTADQAQLHRDVAQAVEAVEEADSASVDGQITLSGYDVREGAAYEHKIAFSVEYKRNGTELGYLSSYRIDGRVYSQYSDGENTYVQLPMSEEWQLLNNFSPPGGLPMPAMLDSLFTWWGEGADEQSILDATEDVTSDDRRIALKTHIRDFDIPFYSLGERFDLEAQQTYYLTPDGQLKSVEIIANTDSGTSALHEDVLVQMQLNFRDVGSIDILIPPDTLHTGISEL